MQNGKTHWGLVFTCIVLGTLALGSLAVGVQSMEAASLARGAAVKAWEAAREAEARAIDAERKASVNRIINCRQSRDLQELRWVHGLAKQAEPMCSDLDIIQP